MPLRPFATRPRTPFLAAAVLAILLNIPLVCRAQQGGNSQSPPDAPSATANSSSRHKTPAAVFGTLARRSIFFPDIAATPGALSTGDKFKLFASDSISFGSVAESALAGAIAQGMDSPEGYGQGWDGYGKRFGSSMARRASSEFFGTFLLASALREDPRFFPQEDPTFTGSVKYSVERLFVTRSDAGEDVANWSGLLGPLMAEGLANAYWPEHERTAGQTFERYGTDLASRIGTNMLRNYWPVFFKKLRGSSHASGRKP